MGRSTNIKNRLRRRSQINNGHGISKPMFGGSTLLYRTKEEKRLLKKQLSDNSLKKKKSTNSKIRKALKQSAERKKLVKSKNEQKETRTDSDENKTQQIEIDKFVFIFLFSKLFFFS